MQFQVNIHHILATGAFEDFADRIAELYAPGEFNPFDSNNTINKIALVTDPVLAQALQHARAPSRMSLKTDLAMKRADRRGEM